MTDPIQPVDPSALARIHALVAAFATEEAPPVRASDRTQDQATKAHDAFVEGEQAEIARQLAPMFWLPPERTYAIFLHAYCALFCIPAFTLEALTRQPDRFSLARLPHTVRTTSGFILDAFGYDRRMESPRKALYWPSLAIRMAHSERGANKPRISNAAMAYFAFHLIRAAEYLSPQQTAADFALRCEQHWDYFGEFLRRADYPFSYQRLRQETFAQEVDRSLAGTDYNELVANALAIAPDMGAALTQEGLLGFLPPHSAQAVAGAVV